MRMYDIIAKKRDGDELSTEEINFFVSGFVKGEIPDYQASALLMAIYLKKMSKRETADLTMAMAKSGDTVDLSQIKGIKVDKHSTGGVGDKTTFVVISLVAAAGVPVAKMSGRGLGHTGGTADKLESIPGYNTALDRETFIRNVNTIKIANVTQTGNLVPADKKIYALRDVTATIENISLIASSIMSKKIAAGADAVVLDVKTGNGAFMKDLGSSFELAKAMVDIGTEVGRNTVALVTDMDQPLGNAIGNSLEVIEAIETLKGKGPKDLEEVCITLAGYMIYLGGRAESVEQAKELAHRKLIDGEGLAKFKQLISYQGGNIEVIDDYELFPQAKIKHEVSSPFNGYVSTIKAEEIGVASMVLGAGRVTKEDKIDYSVGIILKRKVGDKVKEGDVLSVIYANDENKLKQCETILLSSFEVSEEKVPERKLIYGIVTKDGVERV